MSRNTPVTLSILAAAYTMLAACTIIRPDSATQFDFGPLRTAHYSESLPALPPLGVEEVSAPAWLDRSSIVFRLDYANAQQPRVYSQSRWAAPPPQLIEQRLKARIAQAGGAVLPVSEASGNAPVLRIEVNEFAQVFAAPQKSVGHVGMRASLFDDRNLIAQKTFVRQSPAPSPDAAGGAKALAAASDAAISDIIVWLDTLRSK